MLHSTIPSSLVYDARRRVGLGVLLALMGLAVAVVWCLRTSRPVAGTASALPEVERSALVLKEGRLQRNGLVFTGLILEHYPDGSLKSRSTISNGVLYGLSEGWYTNGTLQVTEHFVNGVSHGERLQWDEQAQKVSAAQIVEGRIEGVFRRWHGNGNLSEAVTMKNGQADGLSQAWYPSGFLKAEVTLFQGQMREQHRYRDGERREPVESLAKVSRP